MKELVTHMILWLTVLVQQAKERLTDQPEGRGPDRFPVLGDAFPALTVGQMHEILHKVRVLGENPRLVLQSVHPDYRGKGPRGICAVERGLVELYLTAHPDLHSQAGNYDLRTLVPGTERYNQKSTDELWLEYEIASKVLRPVERRKPTLLAKDAYEVVVRSRKAVTEHELMTQVLLGFIRARKLGKKAGRAQAATIKILDELARRQAVLAHERLAATTQANRLAQLQLRLNHANHRVYSMNLNEVHLLQKAMTTIGAIAGYVQEFGDAGLRVALSRLQLNGYSPEASLIALGSRLVRIMEVRALSDVEETHKESRQRNGYRKVEDWLDPSGFAQVCGLGLGFEDQLREATWFTSSHWQSIQKQMAKLDAA